MYFAALNAYVVASNLGLRRRVFIGLGISSKKEDMWGVMIPAYESHNDSAHRGHGAKTPLCRRRVQTKTDRDLGEADRQ